MEANGEDLVIYAGWQSHNHNRTTTLFPPESRIPPPGEQPGQGLLNAGRRFTWLLYRSGVCFAENTFNELKFETAGSANWH